MKVKYEEGPSALTLPDGSVAQRGEAVEVAKDVAEQLLEQGWQLATKTQKEKP